VVKLKLLTLDVLFRLPDGNPQTAIVVTDLAHPSECGMVRR